MRRKKYSTVKTYTAFTAKLFSSYYLKTCTVSTAEDSKTLGYREIFKSVVTQVCALMIWLFVPYKAHGSNIQSKVFLNANPLYDRGTLS